MHASSPHGGEAKGEKGGQTNNSGQILKKLGSLTS